MLESSTKTHWASSFPPGIRTFMLSPYTYERIKAFGEKKAFKIAWGNQH